jgi:hypothetical protein
MAPDVKIKSYLLPLAISNSPSPSAGTFQIRCMQELTARTAGLVGPNDDCEVDNSAGPEDLVRCLTNAPHSKRPAMFKTHHGMQQQCTPTVETEAAFLDSEEPPPSSWRPCLSLMTTARCTKGQIMRTRLRGDCGVFLPAERFGSLAFWHEVRNPIDAVISAYMFHITMPASEPWLTRWKKASFLFPSLSPSPPDTASHLYSPVPSQLPSPSFLCNAAPVFLRSRAQVAGSQLR